MNWVDITKTLELVRNNLYNNIYIFEETATFTAPKTGYYKIICVGAGSNATASINTTYGTSSARGGNGGGVAIKTKRVSKNGTLSITISTQGVASCDGMTANGWSTTSTAGQATGGDYNYTGLVGDILQSGGANVKLSRNGGSVGCFIPELMTRQYVNLFAVSAHSGYGICGHGGGGGCCIDTVTQGDNTGLILTEAQPAAVIIIPLPSLN